MVAFFQEKIDEVAADESGAAGDECLHQRQDISCGLKTVWANSQGPLGKPNMVVPASLEGV